MFDSLLKDTKNKTVKVVGDQVKAVTTEVASEFGGNSQATESPRETPGAREQTVQQLQGMYGGHEAIMKPTEYAASSAANAQHEATRIPGIFEQLGIKPREPLIPPGKLAEAKRQHQQYVLETFETPHQQPQQRIGSPDSQTDAAQPQSLKSSHEHTSSAALEAEVPVLSGSKGKKPGRNRMNLRMNLKRVQTKTETGASQSSLG